MPPEQARDGDHEFTSELFNCLRKKPRRQILFQLLDHDRQEDLRVPDDIPAEDHDPETHHVQLVHHHLPVLEENGFIRWNREADMIRKGPKFDPVKELLEAIRAGIR